MPFFVGGPVSASPVERPRRRVDLHVPAELDELPFEVCGPVRDLDDPVGGAVAQPPLDDRGILALDDDSAAPAAMAALARLHPYEAVDLIAPKLEHPDRTIARSAKTSHRIAQDKSARRRRTPDTPPAS